jgi:hypothetical protein
MFKPDKHLLSTLPRLELGELSSPFDEALILVNGHEEETIHLECDRAGELADQLVRLVNNRDAIVAALTAAAHALRSYECGNGAPDLARSIAAHCEQLIEQTGAAA